MSTRATYTFIDSYDTFHVYKHHDGYPSGAAKFIANAMLNAWSLPRYEADEFAAAFIAANKDGGGGIRMLHSGHWFVVSPGDIEYRYEVRCGRDGELLVTCYKINNDSDLLLYSGDLEGLAALEG